MKNLAIAMMALAFMSSASPFVRADDDHCPMCGGAMMKDPGEKADHMAVMLDLSEKQKAQVKDLLETKRKKIEPAMEQMRSTMKAASDDFEAGLKKVLDEKQMKKYKAMRSMHDHHMQGMGMEHQ